MVEAKREAVHRKIDLLVQQLNTNGQSEKLKPYFYELFDAILDDAHELRQQKADASDIKVLITEMREGFKRMDSRFEDLIRYMDKRFEEMRHYTDKRLEQIDKRFEELLHYMDKRFEQVDKRFEQADKRFQDLLHYMDKRFEQVEARFSRMYKFMMWLAGLIATGFLGIYLKLFFVG